MRPLLIAALALMAASCTGCHPTKPPVTPTAGDAGAASDDATPAPLVVVTCTPADDHRRSLGCADQPGFLALCLNVNDQRFSDCIAAASSCKAMDGCDPALLAGAKRHP